VPEGQAHLKSPEWGILLILLGGFCFFFLERYLGLKRREKPQFMGMLLDYLPEAIALGGLLALGSPEALLLAIFIGLQNLPEGFNAYRELVVQMGNSRWRTLRFMVSLVVIGPVSGLVGYFFLGEAEGIIGGVMLFAAGGILYLLFQDIAPQSRLERHWAPPLGAVMGFCFTLFIQVWLFQP
jgi:ZIP family zinc transporter